MLTLDTWGPTGDEGEVESSGNPSVKPAGAEEGSVRHGQTRSSPLDSSRVEDEVVVAEPEQQTRGRGEWRCGRNRRSCAAAFLGFLSGAARERESSARGGRERGGGGSTRGGACYAARGGSGELGRRGPRAAGAVDDRDPPVAMVTLQSTPWNRKIICKEALFFTFLPLFSVIFPFLASSTARTLLHTMFIYYCTQHV